MAFVRKVKVKNDKGGYDEYVRIVESYREGGKVKQRIISHLGNVKTLKKDIHRIVNGLLRAVDAHGLVDPATGEKCKAKQYGTKYIRMMVVNKLSDPATRRTEGIGTEGSDEIVQGDG
jgi:hypothetical protein